VPARPEDLRRVTHGDPADRHRGSGGQDGVDLDDPVDPHFRVLSQGTAGKQGSAGGQEAPVADPGPVHVRVRPHQHVIADDARVPGPPAQQRVLHHHAAGADNDLAVFGGKHGPEQDPGLRPDLDRAAQHRGGRDVGAGISPRGVASMLDQHTASLPSSRAFTRGAGLRWPGPWQAGRFIE